MWLHGVYYSGGKTARVPLEVAAGEVLPLAVRIDAQHRYGKQQFSVLVECEGGATKVPLMSEVRVEVRPGPRAFPGTIALDDRHKPGAQVESTVEIYDAYPSPGVAFGEVTVSRPETVRCELKPAAPGVNPAHFAGKADDAQQHRFGFEHRYSLQVSYTVPQVPGWFEDSVRLVPKDPRVPPLIIPITGQTKAPTYTVSPPGVTVPLPAGATTARRVLECRTADDADAELTVVGAPEFAQTAITKTGPGTRRIDVSCSVSPDAQFPLKGEIRVGVGPQRLVVFTIPVKVYRVRDAAAASHQVTK